jgi:transcriptional regulator
VLAAFIGTYPLATLVTCATEMMASHIPLVFHSSSTTANGVLRGHFARANPQSHVHAEGVRALAIFAGPQAYITPNWYPSKRVTQRVVPTWNYAVVHAHGTLKLVADDTFLRDHLRSLTALQESSRPEPWTVDDAPGDYLAAAMKGIIGFEIAIDRIVGKWKLSQNRSAVDRGGVVQGLQSEGNQLMSELVNNAIGPSDVDN